MNGAASKKFDNRRLPSLYSRPTDLFPTNPTVIKLSKFFQEGFGILQRELRHEI